VIGGLDEITPSGYKRWFKVAKKRYYSAWEDAIQQSREFFMGKMAHFE
jgi:hypothetical protein